MGLFFDEVFEIGQFIREHQCKSICMIGKQDIIFTSAKHSQFISDFFGIDINEKSGEIDSYNLFKAICGGEEVHALDYSSYEGADIICDLNSCDLPDEYIGKFDLVIDGGTLEHVFNQNNAINIINRLVREGGYVYHMLPCAGWVNHGFYSYSPTFFEDVYTKENGFEIINLQFYLESKVGTDILESVSQDCRLFKDYVEMNEYLSRNNDVERVRIKCLAKKIMEKDFGCPIQGFYQELYEKNEKTIYKLDSLNKFIDAVRTEKRISFYGCGKNCNRLFNELYMNDLWDAVDCVFDSDVNRAGTLFRGKIIQYPTKANLSKTDSKILISSLVYEEDILDILVERGVEPNRVIKLSNLL